MKKAVMKRVRLLFQKAGFFCALLLLASCTSIVEDSRKPNIVWLVSEDNSLHYLDHFHAGGAKTPNIEKLANSGITFTNAYSNSPVCSVARTTLATGMYAPRIGAQYHRAYKKVDLPENAKLIHEYLKDAGYYVTNKSKTDYNVELGGRKTWHASSKNASWRNRLQSDQPFFHMETLFLSHESSLHFDQDFVTSQLENLALDNIKVPDYLPNTELVKFTQAYYQQRIQEVDSAVGEIVNALEQDGLLEDTFIFYFSDHGGVLPRGKGYLYESGVHIPLVVRVPKKFRHLVAAESAIQVDGTVEFVDFGPTLLKLAGIDLPDHFDGEPFLGKGISLEEVNSRQESFQYADRFDEKIDMVRAYKKGRFHYIRSFQPYYPNGMHGNYRYKMLAYQQWRELNNNNELTPEQQQFFQQKPVESLFDTETDPHELVNLADNPDYQSVLLEMRQLLIEQMKSLPDVGFYPESYLFEYAMPAVSQFAVGHEGRIAELIDISNLIFQPYAEARVSLNELLTKGNPIEQYWALIVASSFGDEARDLMPIAARLVFANSEVVRIRAAEFLGIMGSMNPQPTLMHIVNNTSNPVVATEALNVMVFFADKADGAYPVNVSAIKPAVDGKGIAARLTYLKQR